MQIITSYERQKIEYYLRLKMGIREIARRLKRDHSVISREVRRNKERDMKYYSAKRAQEKADLHAKKTNKRKLDKDFMLRLYVTEKLKMGWSPEEIAGRLSEYPEPYLRGSRISYESIYAYIYETIQGRHMYRYLRRKTVPRRQRRYSRKKHAKIIIHERISIHERPEIINERNRVGDWESDTMCFRKQKTGLSVQYERKLMLTKIHRIENKTSEATQEALIKSIESSNHNGLWRSITFDNGLEGSCHANMRAVYGLQTYFCDPYASWQKGGVENANGLIREYLPKGTNMDTITERNIYEIQETLNNRPRKKLRYLTPNESLKHYLITVGGALNS
jgi:IS30 family transposase